MSVVYSSPRAKRCSCVSESSLLKGTIHIVEIPVTDENEKPTAAPNGPVPSLGARSSPAPSNVPNGKPTSPFSERQQSPVPSPQQMAPQTVSSKDPRAAAQQASEMRNVVRKKLTGYVGFANLPNQWHRKSVRKGFNFNVMVVGRWLHYTFFYLCSLSQVNPVSESLRL